MGSVLFNLTIFLYLLSTFLYLGHLVHQKDFFSRWATWCMILAFSVHTLSLLYRFLVFGSLPFGSLPLSLSFYSWTLVGIFLLMLINFRIHVMGSFISPLAFIAVLISFSKGWSGVTTREPWSGILKSAWVPLHVTFSLIGDSLFALAFCAGILYLIQEYRLKKRKALVRISSLPSLETLDRVNFRCLTIGFPLLTVGLIIGAIGAEYTLNIPWRYDPKVIWSVLTWFLYAGMIHARLIKGWRGKKAAILAIFGFIIVSFSYLGVNIFLTGYHHFY